MNLSNSDLGIFLSAAVPLRVIELKSRGGPTEEDMVNLQKYQKLLGEHGDALLFKVKKKGLTTQVANALSNAVAILSFIPGGITLFDQHWESFIEKSPHEENVLARKPSD